MWARPLADEAAADSAGYLQRVTSRRVRALVLAYGVVALLGGLLSTAASGYGGLALAAAGLAGIGFGALHLTREHGMVGMTTAVVVLTMLAAQLGLGCAHGASEHAGWWWPIMLAPLATIPFAVSAGTRMVVAVVVTCGFVVAVTTRQPPPPIPMQGLFALAVATAVAVAAGAMAHRALHTAIEQRVALERRVAARTQALGQLATHLDQAREDERRRLARDLHDDTSQLLSSMRIELGVVRQLDHSERVGTSLDRLDGLVEQSFAAYRRMIKTLRPEILDARGFGPALRWLCESTQERTGIEIETQAVDRFDALDGDTSLVAFRAAQEALTNVARHAEATRATVSAALDDGRLHISITDDGRGFRPEEVTSGHLGLLILKERVRAAGGEVTVTSMPGTGTRIEVTLQVSEPSHAETHS